MSTYSDIEWTDASWNPTTGCNRVSPGCLNCYEMPLANRLMKMGQWNYRNGTKLTVHPHMLPRPLQWKKPKKIFVNSMSDLFHEDVPDDFIRQVCDVMLTANQHTYQILTKRPERMSRMLQGVLRDAATVKHIWWGVSVENIKHGLPRIELLRDADTVVPWLSIEPLIEDLGQLDLDSLKWIVVGGESGSGARPMHPDWVRSIREQCQSQGGIPFFFKQWGGVRKSLTGRVLDGRTYDDFPDLR